MILSEENCELFHFFLEKLTNIFNFRRIQMETLVHICQFYFPENVDFENWMADQSIYFHIQDMALNINETLFNCHWKGKTDSCLRLFTPVLTDEGVCFTFNALNSHEIFTERYGHFFVAISIFSVQFPLQIKFILP